MLANMTSLQIAKASALTQPSVVVTSEVCSYVVFRDVSILLTLVKKIPSTIVPIVEVSMTSLFC